MIEVILLERIERLGQMGQVVKVRPGFARNFLLPQNKALRATKANLEVFEKQRAQLEAHNNAERAKAEKLGTNMDGLKLVVIRQASETGQLYGSVSARDVSEAAKETGHAINRAQVQIDQPIKALGLFPVKVKLHPEVAMKITINVARSPEEAVVQAEKGAAVTKAAEEKAEVVAAFHAPAEKPKAKKKPRKAQSQGSPTKKTKPRTSPRRLPTRPADEDDEPKAKTKAARPRSVIPAKAKNVPDGRDKPGHAPPNRLVNLKERGPCGPRPVPFTPD